MSACARRRARSSRRSGWGCGGDFFAKFFPWVWVSVLLLLASGYWMLLTSFGGFAGAPLYINLMQALGLIMIALFIWLFHGPWLKFKRAVDAENWPAAGAQLNRIREIIMINLPLGLIVVVIGGTGRYWGLTFPSRGSGERVEADAQIV